MKYSWGFQKSSNDTNTQLTTHNSNNRCFVAEPKLKSLRNQFFPRLQIKFVVNQHDVAIIVTMLYVDNRFRWKEKSAWNVRIWAMTRIKMENWFATVLIRNRSPNLLYKLPNYPENFNSTFVLSRRSVVLACLKWIWCEQKTQNRKRFVALVWGQYLFLINKVEIHISNWKNRYAVSGLTIYKNIILKLTSVWTCSLSVAMIFTWITNATLIILKVSLGKCAASFYGLI